jgi:enoyl-CoA hydratase
VSERFAGAAEAGLLVEIDDRVARLTIDRPERRNALDIGLTRALVEALVELGEDDGIWAISLTAAGEKAFCAGTDLKELDAIASRGERIPQPMRGPERNLFEVLSEVGKPTIAVVNGPALAAGCELVLACDLRVATEEAYLALPEAKRGMGANFASVVLPRLLPRAVAMEMLYLGEPLPAAEALRWGIYNRVVPAADLREAGEALVQAVIANAPLTLRRYKQMVTKGAALPLQSALRLDVGPNPYRSEDREEGVRAFLERRPARWQGR